MIVSEKKGGAGRVPLDGHPQLRKRKAASGNARPGTHIFLAATGTIPFLQKTFAPSLPAVFSF